MNAAALAAALLGLGTLFASVRAWRNAQRHRRARTVLQIAVAVLLYLCLFPPSTRESFAAGELVVLTAGASDAQLDALGAAAASVALPGAPERNGIERVPDLGTALRRHPGLRRLHVIGGGLPMRDRDVARGFVTSFDAAPLPRGMVELDVPPGVHAGNLWRLSGRVEGVADGRVELRDPSGAIVASAALDADGRFALDAQAKSEGEALFALRVLDRAAARVDDVGVALAVRGGDAPNVLLLAGAPDPELKYLRRWALDAGMRLDTRMRLSEGIALTEGNAALDAGALRGVDLAIVDERAWAALGAAQKDALAAAVRDGLGLLLRVTGPLPAPVAADWAALGFPSRPGDAAAAVSLAKTFVPAGTAPAFTRRALDVEAADAAPLLRADDGAPLALWRAQGQGRVALWWLADSWRLALGGARAQYGTLWSGTFATLARARGTPFPVLPDTARVDERAVLCGLAPDAAIETKNGERTMLAVEHGLHARDCAAYWPAQAGWHTLLSGGTRWPFHVRATDEARSLVIAGNMRATRELLAAPTERAELATRPRPLPRWPFFLVWLAAMVLLWAVERHAAAAPGS